MSPAAKVASSTVALDPCNRKTWDNPRIAAKYKAARALTPGELRVICEAWPDIRAGRILDIGVGAGRTIPYLAPAGESYLAIDYAREMVAAARQSFPGVDVREGDARDLALPDGQFDFVLFSFNGIDYAHPDERNRVLTEVYRVLRPGGLFAFSTHNKNILPRNGFQLEFPAFTFNPARYVVRVARFVRARSNRNRLGAYALWRDDIAFVIDNGALSSSLLTCYVKPQAQLDALRTAGFGALLLMIDDEGKDMTVNGLAPWIYFLVRKPFS